MGEAKDIQKGLNKTDNDKLNEYFESIRDIETRLGKDEQWLSVPKAKSPIPEPKPGLAGKEEIKVMYDLIAAALFAAIREGLIETPTRVQILR